MNRRQLSHLYPGQEQTRGSQHARAMQLVAYDQTPLSYP